jgi:hypothetical protein
MGVTGALAEPPKEAACTAEGCTAAAGFFRLNKSDSLWRATCINLSANFNRKQSSYKANLGSLLNQGTHDLVFELQHV